MSTCSLRGEITWRRFKEKEELRGCIAIVRPDCIARDGMVSFRYERNLQVDSAIKAPYNESGNR